MRDPKARLRRMIWVRGKIGKEGEVARRRADSKREPSGSSHSHEGLNCGDYHPCSVRLLSPRCIPWFEHRTATFLLFFAKQECDRKTGLSLPRLKLSRTQPDSAGSFCYKGACGSILTPSNQIDRVLLFLSLITASGFFDIALSYLFTNHFILFNTFFVLTFIAHMSASNDPIPSAENKSKELAAFRKLPLEILWRIVSFVPKD